MGRFDTDTAADEDVPLRQVVTAAGRTIYRQGSAAFQAFYIEEGRVEVSIEEGSQTITLCELGPGDLFGDIGVLTSELHKTTVTALENTTVSVLKKEDLTARLQGVEDKYIQALIK
ncbi:MAG: cyclic nucleotide-binding domain-containing protein, partial [Alphaproteobacteria bacterium]|nr:cyclic nucleotide-binding domain-containing protein [Alphaproteobacteria bacterium]